jgi:hypothetical protein
VELPTGATRIAPPLASALIGSWAPQLAEAVGPIVEHVAGMVASEAGLGKQPTLITQRARSAGRVRRKAPKPPTTSRFQPALGGRPGLVRASGVDECGNITQ